MRIIRLKCGRLLNYVGLMAVKLVCRISVIIKDNEKTI